MNNHIFFCSSPIIYSFKVWKLKKKKIKSEYGSLKMKKIAREGGKNSFFFFFFFFLKSDLIFFLLQMLLIIVSYGNCYWENIFQK